MLVAYVLWWIGVFWLFVTALVVISVLIYTGNMMDRTMSPVLFMAPVGFATAGTEAGAIATKACCMSARLAGPMLVVGYFATGVALFMAILLYTLYFHRLLAAGWSAPSQRAGMFILVSVSFKALPITSYPTDFSDWSLRSDICCSPTSREGRIHGSCRI